MPFLICLMAVVLTMAGCDRLASRTETADSNSQATVSPLRAMNAAIRKADWNLAWTFADAVLLEHADDPEVLVKVARVAYESKYLDKSADLLLDANRIEGFKNPLRVQQAMVGMISAGRLYDGIELLEEALEQQPQQLETRRWLFDFLIGTENRLAALPHGRLLIKERKFDLELLLALSNTEVREKDSAPLADMVARNPNDVRPLIGKARAEFDKGLLPESITTLRSIIDKFPDDTNAQVLLGLALATSGKYEELESWLAGASGRCESHFGYWITLGDWSRHEQRHAEAARGYWEATQRDPDVMESWSKLNAGLNQLQSEGIQLPTGMIEATDKRSSQLSRFQQLKRRFVRTGSISRATVVDMVKVLVELGRLWEAEAWASIATTLPDDNSVPLAAVRQSVVKGLRANTPWQLLDEHPELQLSLARFPLPSLAEIASASVSPATRLPPALMPPTKPASSSATTAKLRFENEATERGVIFFGKTGRDLDKPGIALYKTLGCGGGTIDFDLDGWPDLYLLAAGGTPPNRDSEPNALVRNVAGKFVDVTGFTATGDTGFGQGVAVGDINEDGFPDLLVFNYGPNRLYINCGDGTFCDATTKLGDQSQWSTCGAIADLNGDAISDLIVVNYCAGLEPVTKLCPIVEGGEARSCSPVTFAAEADVVLSGTPEGDFIDQTKSWGVQPSVVGRGLGIVVGSLDAQAGVDVMIANDMTTNHYWSRPAGDMFQWIESAMPRGLAGDGRSLAQGSMGIATGDLDQDGDLDFYVTNFDNEYNTLYEQRASGVWQDQTSVRGLVAHTLPLVGFGTAAVDMENDGRLELVVTNGHVDLFPDGESRSQYAQPMQIFRRGDGGEYESIGQMLAGDYLTSQHVGRALWTADINRDGRTDAVVTHQTEPVAVLVNRTESPNHFLEIRLVGTSCARDAIGTIVELSVGEQRFVAALTAGDGYECSGERVLRFGLGSTNLPADIKVHWPDGTKDEFFGLTCDTHWLLVQAGEPFELPMPQSQ